MNHTGPLLQNFGAVIGIWAVVWFAWDHNANAPGWMPLTAIGSLITGAYLL